MQLLSLLHPPTEMFGGVLAAIEFDPWLWGAQQMQALTVNNVRLTMWMIENSPDPHVLSDWFRGEYGIMLRLAMFLMVPIILAATVGALLRGGIQQVLRTYLWALPVGVFGGFITLALVDLCVQIDNDMTTMVLSSSDDTMKSFYAAINANTDGAVKSKILERASAAQFLVIAAVFVFSFILVLEMFFREIMIYMAVMFIPMSLAAFIWGPVRIWFYNLAELVVTMVFAKFVIASVMSFGFAALAYGFTGNGDLEVQQTGVLFGGMLIMFLACWAGPVIIVFIMAPSHSILSRQEAQQLQPWNHDRRFAGQLFAGQLKSGANLLKKIGTKGK